jgi:membrane dipeptidase
MLHNFRILRIAVIALAWLTFITPTRAESPSSEFVLSINVSPPSCAGRLGQFGKALMVSKGKSPQMQDAFDLIKNSVVFTNHDHCFTAADLQQMSDPARAGMNIRVVALTTDGIQWIAKDDSDPGFRVVLPSQPVINWFIRGNEAIDFIEHETSTATREANRPIEILKTVQDLKEVAAGRKRGVILSFEGARPLGEHPSVGLVQLYARGLRHLQLRWAETPNLLQTSRGLREEVIRKANELGIVLDFSHTNGPRFAEDLNQHIRSSSGVRPCVVSHTCVSPNLMSRYWQGQPLPDHTSRDLRSAQRPASADAVGCVDGRTEVCVNHTDALNDEAIARIASVGGVLSLHFMNAAKHPSRPLLTVQDLVDEIEVVRKIVGIEYVGLGPDYFPEARSSWAAGASYEEGLLNLVAEMRSRKGEESFTPEEICRVVGGNLFEVYVAAWGRTQRKFNTCVPTKPPPN